MTNIWNGMTNQDMQTAISDIAAQQQQLYSRESRELISHYNRETGALDGYRGRQILELLQNADDAGVDSDKNIRATFYLDRNCLIVANTGASFTYDGLMSLIISDCSPKQLHRNRFIGCKGLGFRSVLTWTDRPLIVSGSLRVLFDKKEALAFVQKLADSLQHSNPIKQFHESMGYWPVPIMRFPLAPDVDDPDFQVVKEFLSKGFTTVIVLPIPEGKSGDTVFEEAKIQLDQISTTTLLFCRYLEEVKIEGVLNKSWSMVREEICEAQSQIIISDGRSEIYWDVYRHSGKVPEEMARESTGGQIEYETAIAVPESTDIPYESNTLSVFFPTREHLPCPIVMHATLETTEDRNRIVNNSSNLHVLEALSEHLSDIIKSHVLKDEPLRVLYLLNGIQDADPELKELGFIDLVKDNIQKSKILPRLDGKFGTADNTLQAPDDVWSELVSSEYFPDMLALNEQHDLNDIIDWLELPWLDNITLKSRLKTLLKSLDPEKAGKIAGKLIDANQLKNIGVNGLLLEKKGTLIGENEECFFNPTSKLPPLPSWAKGVRFLDADFQTALFDHSSSTSLRGLVGTLENNKGSVSEYNFNTVARAVISRLNKEDEQEDRDDKKRWQELLPWLYKASDGSRHALPQLSIKVITTQGNLKRANSCYLSDHYPKGELISKLYKSFDQDEYVASPSGLNMENVSIKLVEKFLISLGVHAHPREVRFDRSNENYPRFLEHVIDTLAFPIPIRYNTFNTPVELRKYFSSYEITELSIPERFTEIVKLENPSALVAFLISDGQRHISNENATSAIFQAKTYDERRLWADPSVPIPNPVLTLLRETAWVPCTDGLKRKPSEIMLNNIGLRILNNIFFRHSVNYADPLIVSRGGKRALESLLMRLGAVTSLESMDSEQVYDLLLTLPDRDPDGKSVSSIYRTLLESQIVIEDGPNRAEFLKKGKVWAKLHDVSQYLHTNEVRYNANVTLPRVIENRMALLDLPSRRSSKAVDQLLNVKQLTSKDVQLTVKHDETEFDVRSEEANAFLHRCIPYIYALRLGKKLDDNLRERNLLKNTKLFVCNKLTVLVSVEDNPPETLVLDSNNDRISIDSKLYLVSGCYSNDNGLTSFWLSVAGLIAEIIGTDVEAEVGQILRCRSESEMQLVVNSLLGNEAEEKLNEAHRRFDTFDIDEAEDEMIPIPAANDQDDSQISIESSEDSEQPSDSNQDSEAENNDNVNHADSRRTTKFQKTEGPDRKSRKRRKLVLRRGGSSGGGKTGRGPVATEDVTFAIIEEFEKQDSPSRYVIDVSKIQGKEGFGCDLISVKSKEIKERVLAEKSIFESDIERYIEVKGRSSRTGSVELTENEYNAAVKHKERYCLYRVFVDPEDTSIYEVAILCDPVNSDAVQTVTRFDLAKGSGAEWYCLEEIPEDHNCRDV